MGIIIGHNNYKVNDITDGVKNRSSTLNLHPPKLAYSQDGNLIKSNMN